MGKGVPDRWEDYSNMGRQIPGTRFFAFKVPLKDASLNTLPATVDPFGPQELMEYCPSLGLVIDLTNTNRYYDPQLLVSEGIQYEKINTEGHVIPKNFVVQRFFKAVDTFLEGNARNDKLIGVHCTHGVNRTGYLICRYMIEQLGVPPNQAISAFNNARGHALERENYLDNLRKCAWRNGPPHPSRGRGFRTRPFSRGNERFTSSSEGYFSPPFVPRFNSSLEDDPPHMPGFNDPERATPPHKRGFNDSERPALPYMPHPNRRMMRGGPHPSISVRFSRSPVGRRISFGNSPDPGPFHGERPHEVAGPRQPSHPGRGGRGINANFSNSWNRDQEGPMDEETFRPPAFRKMHDNDFYSRGKRGGPIGPHRPFPRDIPHPPLNQRPSVYRGPRPFRPPPRLEEPFQNKQYSNQQTQRVPYGRGSGRTVFIPDTPVDEDEDDYDDNEDDIFSPENEEGRKRYNRFRPY